MPWQSRGFKSRSVFLLVLYSVAVMLFSVGHLLTKTIRHFKSDNKHAKDDGDPFDYQVWAPVFNGSDTSNVIHSSYFNDIEDIMSMTPPTTSISYKNPCWLETRTTRKKSSKRLRCLPYFEIAGVSKSGTTDLFNRLVKHPNIIKNSGSGGKETWYWSRRRYGLDPSGKRGKKMTLYKFIDLFNAAKIDATVDQTGYHNLITGHRDPIDLWEDTEWRKLRENFYQESSPIITKATLIHHINPGLKVIFLLRNPIERTYSHYYDLRLGKNPKEFHEYITNATAEANQCLEKSDVRTCIYRKNTIGATPADRGLLWISMYSVYLKEWFRVFPKNHILIIRSEDYKSNVTKTLSHVFKFLEIEPPSAKTIEEIDKMPFANPSKFKKKIDPMFPETRDILQTFFSPFNKDLSKLLRDKKYLWSDITFSY